MFDLIVHYLVSRLGDAGDDDSDGSGFAGSLLDWSVNYGHGTAGNAEATREMARIQKKAELLEDEEYRN